VWRLETILSFSSIIISLADGGRKRLEGLASVWRLQPIRSFSSVQIAAGCLAILSQEHLTDEPCAIP
jgi:hypothetical protein